MGIKTSSEFINASPKPQNLCLYLSLVRQIFMKHNFLSAWRKHQWLCLLNTNQWTFSCLNKLHVVIKSLRGVELSLGHGQTALGLSLDQKEKSGFSFLNFTLFEHDTLLSLLLSTALYTCTSVISFYVCFQHNPQLCASDIPWLLTDRSCSRKDSTESAGLF